MLQIVQLILWRSFISTWHVFKIERCYFKNKSPLLIFNLFSYLSLIYFLHGSALIVLLATNLIITASHKLVQLLHSRLAICFVSLHIWDNDNNSIMSAYSSAVNQTMNVY